MEKSLLEKWRALSPERQKKAIEFVESLDEVNGNKHNTKSSRGLWKKLNIDISEAEIDEIRREMWANFPRDIDL